MPPLRRRTPVLLVLAVLLGCSPATDRNPPSRTTPPPAAGRVDYQLGGPYPPHPTARITVRDSSARPVPGLYNICYVNAFQTQPGTLTTWLRRHPDLVLSRGGRPVTDPDWPDEALLDTSTDSGRRKLAALLDADLARCERSGFDAVEPDNLDSYLRSGGRLVAADNVALIADLARRAHARGLAVAQKNAPEIGRAGRDTAGLDFAIAEECQVYRECDHYTGLYGRRVIEIEYTDNGAKAFARACGLRGREISVLLRDRDVVRRGEPGYVSRWCA